MENKKKYLIELPTELIMKLKSDAAIRGVSLKLLLSQIITQWLKR